jgi:hypothetical protein
VEAGYSANDLMTLAMQVGLDCKKSPPLFFFAKMPTTSLTSPAGMFFGLKSKPVFLVKKQAM